MSIPINPGYHYCKNIKKNVSLEQTEGQCRERHNCGDGPCPLEFEFKQSHFLRLFAYGSIGLRNWLKLRGSAIMDHARKTYPY
jgi:hypothetical protein